MPRRLIWDNEPGIGRRGVTEPVAVFAGTLATKVVLLPRKDPQSKGIVERRNGFFETSFMPGRHFESPADFNAQFTDWLTTANARVVRTIKAHPSELLAADKEAMLPLPPAVMHLRWRNHVRLGRDYYVRVDTCDYSVDPRAIGARVDVSADLDTVRRLGLPFVVVVYDDAAYGAEVHHFTAGEPLGTVTFPETDIAAVGAGYGFDTVTVRRPEDVEGVRRWVDGDRSRPLLVHARVASPEGSWWLQEAFRGH